MYGIVLHFFLYNVYVHNEGVRSWDSAATILRNVHWATTTPERCLHAAALLRWHPHLVHPKTPTLLDGCLEDYHCGGWFLVGRCSKDILRLQAMLLGAGLKVGERPNPMHWRSLFMWLCKWCVARLAADVTFTPD